MSYDPIHDTYTPAKPKDPQSSPPNAVQKKHDPLSISSLVSEEKASSKDPFTEAAPAPAAMNTPSRTRNAHKIQAISNLIEAETENDGDDDYDETDVNSTNLGDDEDYSGPSPSSNKTKKKPHAAASSPSSSSSSKKKKKSNIANSKLSLKKGDGEPFWRRDIQYDMLTALFDDETACFTNTYPHSNLPGVNNSPKVTFAELYIRTLAESNKCSKVLKEKLLRDFDLGKAVSKVCVLVNAGRMNTTINFVHDMKSTLRTYHSIPCLQTGPQGGTIRQLQDTPRLKSIIKAVNEGQEQKVTSLEQLVASPPSIKPNTDIVHLLFLLSEANNGIPLIKDRDFHLLDLFVNTKATPQSRANLLLWLFYTFLETDFTPQQLSQNPFGGSDAPHEDPIPESSCVKFDVDTQYEIDYAAEMLQARKLYLSEDHSHDGHHVSQRTQDTRAGAGAGAGASTSASAGGSSSVNVTTNNSAAPKVNSKKREAKNEETNVEHEDGEKKVSKPNPPKKKQKKTSTETLSPLSKSIISLSMRSLQKPSSDMVETRPEEGEEEKVESHISPKVNINFPINGIEKSIRKFTKSPFISPPPQPNFEESIEFKCDLLEATNPLVHEVRTSSKASTASFNKKITILGNWLYRYFNYKKSIANKFVGLEWEDIRHDLVSGVETYLYQNFGKSLTTNKLLTEMNDDDANEVGKSIDGIGSIDDVVFNYIPVGDFDKANEKKSFLLHLTTFVNDFFINKMESELNRGALKSNITFDLENENMSM
ncbi:hypothetical protein KGF57_004443 [Candida theae]|uniref:Ino eighty subunit 1 n=1 Tax=Candida theae TaxID=1198502 RepID=A0AAD5BAX2_9ASCO|nr:uncharacterized protein KGF57_004443 [Candida theae]KAI5949933.1 hypothetical protein KGF57_004443 [Candida theae]